MIKWEVAGYSGEIYKINVVSETEKTYMIEKEWYGGKSTNRVMKSGRNIFATWGEAKAFSVSSAEEVLKARKRQVEVAQRKLEEAQALEPQKED